LRKACVEDRFIQTGWVKLLVKPSVKTHGSNAFEVTWARSERETVESVKNALVALQFAGLIGGPGLRMVHGLAGCGLLLRWGRNRRNDKAETQERCHGSLDQLHGNELPHWLSCELPEMKNAGKRAQVIDLLMEMTPFYWESCGEKAAESHTRRTELTLWVLLAAPFAASHDGGVETFAEIGRQVVDLVGTIDFNGFTGCIQGDFAMLATTEVLLQIGTHFGRNGVVNQIVEQRNEFSAGHFSTPVALGPFFLRKYRVSRSRS
jgi:hypothetical protein